MRWWTKQKIIKSVIYLLMAFVFINSFLFELCPTLYPEWLRNIVEFSSLIIIIFWFVWCITYLIKKHKNRK